MKRGHAQKKSTKLNCDNTIKSLYFAVKQHRQLEQRDFEVISKVMEERFPQLLKLADKPKKQAHWLAWMGAVSILVVFLIYFV